MRLRTLLFAGLLSVSWACGSSETEGEPDLEAPDTLGDSKADEFSDFRVFDSLFTDPHCDVCTNADKDHLLATSEMLAKTIELIDNAQSSIDVAQFTFSRDAIEAALLRAHQRGVAVRIAMNHQQAQGDNPSTRLRDAGLPVRFIEGKDVGRFVGLQHAKFMIVDGKTISMGSNNFSSTGFSINEENTMVMTSTSQDPIVSAFSCYFEKMYESQLGEGASCSTPDARFTPSTHPWKMLRDEMRGSQRSIEVLMHHLVFTDAVKELAKAAERGVHVRVIVNAEDRDETQGSNWDRLRAAGAEIRYKQTNGQLYQFMHHKLAIIDGKTLLNGSGNWSGSAFFNNWEFYVRIGEAEVVREYRGVFTRLWNWSLTAESLDAGLDARGQDVATTDIYFGNLHAHFHALDGGRMLDDGKLEREVNGEVVPVDSEADGQPMKHAYEYARDRGGLDFLALSPHVVDDDPNDDPNSIANMTPAAYAQLIDTAKSVSEDGVFVALPSFEWSTNSTGNHVNVFGSAELSKVVRGDFKTFYEGYLPLRRSEGDDAFIMLNHPRTFRHYDSLNGSWDQIFGVNLSEIPNASDRAKKFNDFGIDDFPPMSEHRASWIDGVVMPDEAVVRETQLNIAAITAPYHRLMEVTVSRGTEFTSETAQNPSLSENSETGETERFTKVHSDWDYYLANGWRLAPAASHDNHAANWGTGHTSRTAVIAGELSERGLLDAIGERAVYASEDENLEIRLYAENRVRAGSELRTIQDSTTLQLFMTDPDYSGSYVVNVWGGAVGGEATLVKEMELTADTWHSIDVQLVDGPQFYYVEVLESTPQRMAWSAPVFVVRETR